MAKVHLFYLNSEWKKMFGEDFKSAPPYYRFVVIKYSHLFETPWSVTISPTLKTDDLVGSYYIGLLHKGQLIDGELDPQAHIFLATSSLTNTLHPSQYEFKNNTFFPVPLLPKDVYISEIATYFGKLSYTGVKYNKELYQSYCNTGFLSNPDVQEVSVNPASKVFITPPKSWGTPVKQSYPSKWAWVYKNGAKVVIEKPTVESDSQALKELEALYKEQFQHQTKTLKAYYPNHVSVKMDNGNTLTVSFVDDVQ
jgi:hypothetical protein